MFYILKTLWTCRSKTGGGYLFPFPEECSTILKEFADYSSYFTRCSILNARPIRICEQCLNDYISFRDKYQELLTTVVNGTSCKALFISHDRLDAVLEYHDNILSIWNKAHCQGMYGSIHSCWLTIVTYVWLLDVMSHYKAILNRYVKSHLYYSSF